MTAKLPVTPVIRAAHDMRTLLALLQADISRWQSKLEQSDPKSQLVREASAMYAHTQRLGDLLGSLLVASNTQERSHIFDLSHELESVIAEYQKAFPKVQFHFHNSSPALVNGWQTEMRTVLQNVIENALKYGQNHDAIPSINCTLEKIGKKYHVQIVDRGPGIAKQDLSKVFIPFYRGKNATVPGSGLGLSIAREIILQHRGKITIQSTVGQGTEIHIVLPIL